MFPSFIYHSGMEKATSFARLYPSDHRYLLRKARKGGGKAKPIADIVHDMVLAERNAVVNKVPDMMP